MLAFLLCLILKITYKAEFLPDLLHFTEKGIKSCIKENNILKGMYSGIKMSKRQISA